MNQKQLLKDRIARMNQPKERAGSIVSAEDRRPRRDTSALIIQVDRIKPDPDQVRSMNKSRSDTSVKELAQSIEDVGLIEPLVVRLIEDESGGYYKLIAGERRYVAVQLLGWDEVPVKLQDVDDRRAMQIQLMENLHRENLQPLEVGAAFQRLLDEGSTIKDVAVFAKKSQSYVRQALQVNRGLSDEAKTRVEGLSMGHLYEVAQLKPAEQTTVLVDIQERGLSREQTRTELANAKQKAQRERGSNKATRAGKKAFQQTITASNGLKITISARKKRVSNAEIVMALQEIIENGEVKAAA